MITLSFNPKTLLYNSFLLITNILIFWICRLHIFISYAYLINMFWTLILFHNIGRFLYMNLTSFFLYATHWIFYMFLFLAILITIFFNFRYAINLLMNIWYKILLLILGHMFALLYIGFIHKFLFYFLRFFNVVN